MGLITTIKNWLGAGNTSRSGQLAPGEALVATISNGEEQTRLAIPDDNEFRKRGWIIGDWFNQRTLATALAVQPGVDASRETLQKVAYEITRPSHPEEQQQWFRECMTQFVRLDPMYQKTIGRVRDMVRQRPGVVQSEIYKERTEPEMEVARYVLYFAHELGDIRREKAGRSYKLYLPDEMERHDTAQQVGETRYLAGGAVSAKVTVRTPTEQEQQINSLHKQATAAAGDKDFASAVTHLEEAQQLMATASVDYEVERYLRLPNYLQQAGRMADAEAIFEELLATRQQGHEQAAIHNQMRIAYNREKRYDLAFLHGMQHILWRCVDYAEQDGAPEGWQSREYWAPELEKLLKRAKRPDLREAALEALTPFLVEPGRETLASTMRAMQELFDTQHGANDMQRPQRQDT
ncbi:hypothetical protein KZO25_11080 [Halomonas sp. ANAO-440]|uniref:hypothetical protein n=1 Tax=Halomonas sp. ANAO-440 TaxID=2861360 RepID=UPI001CAA474A|nr:hypothetical protein [Halomonas sp. ANAO-440]MBZ0330857.1 hypothetical protein [Halomonas sp. ANAO-440]